MRTQVGIDPAQCDPATLALWRSKFFGVLTPALNKQNKKKHVATELGEDDEAQVHRKE